MKNEISRRVHWLCASLATALCFTFAAASEIGATDDLEFAVDALSPGEELVLRGGADTFLMKTSLSRRTVRLCNRLPFAQKLVKSQSSNKRPPITTS
jgi:hypothetical protein